MEPTSIHSVSVRPPKGRFRAALRRLVPTGEPGPWERYLDSVEPPLAGRPRVHRFAAPPLLGPPDAPVRPLVVWIDGDPGRAAATKAALASGSVAPAAIVEGSLPDALAQTRAGHVMLVQAGDRPAANAVERLGQAIALAPDAAVITCDHDRLSTEGARHAPHFAPGPSPDRWLACDDSGPLLVIERERAASQCSTLSTAPAWRHQLALALAGPGGEGHAHVPLIL